MSIIDHINFQKDKPLKNHNFQASVHDFDSLMDANHFLSHGLTQLIKHRDMLGNEEDLTDDVIHVHMGVIETVAKMTMCHDEFSLDMEAKGKSLKQKYDLFIQGIAVKIIGVFKAIDESLKKSSGGIIMEKKQALKHAKFIDELDDKGTIELYPDQAKGLYNPKLLIDFKNVSKNVKLHNTTPALEILDFIKQYLADYIKVIDDRLETSENETIDVDFTAASAKIKTMLGIKSSGDIESSDLLPGLWKFTYNKKSKKFDLGRDISEFKYASTEEYSIKDVKELFKLTLAQYDVAEKNYLKINKELTKINDLIFKEMKDSKNSANQKEITEAIASSVRNTSDILSAVNASLEYTYWLFQSVNEVTKFTLEFHDY